MCRYNISYSSGSQSGVWGPPGVLEGVPGGPQLYDSLEPNGPLAYGSVTPVVLQGPTVVPS